jgi:hypothetical protein
MKRFGYREIRAIANTVSSLLVSDNTIGIFVIVVAIVPVTIVMVALVAALTALAATLAAAAFSHIFLYKGYIKKMI